MSSREEEESIRPPDPVVRETLIDHFAGGEYGWKTFHNNYGISNHDDRLSFVSDNDDMRVAVGEPPFATSSDTQAIPEHELQAILESSRLEYETQFNVWLEQMKQEEITKRKTRFETAKRQLLRITKVDADASIGYITLLGGINAYENGEIEHNPVFHPPLYSEILSAIRSLRMSTQEREDLVQFISP